jgi:propanol-preferring alcohol dehydrogenase
MPAKLGDMRAMVVETSADISSNPIREAMLPDPAPGRGQLLLAVQACAVCRTDLQLAEGDIEAKKPSFVPGHQVVGIVEAIGDGVSGWKVGERAGVAWLAGACGTCRFCTSGRENLCLDARFTGWDVDGGFATLAAVDARFALRLPDDLPSENVAPLLFGGVIGYRALRRSGIESGGRLGLFGYGASAHLALQVATHWACEAYVFTRSEREQARAIATGARWAGDYDASPDVALDAAITFAPVGNVVVSALRHLDRGGVIAINAIHLDAIPSFSYDLLWWEREIRSVANFTRQDAQEFLDLAAEIPIETQVQVFPLTEANEALRQLKSGELQGTAVLVPGNGR